MGHVLPDSPVTDSPVVEVEAAHGSSSLVRKVLSTGAMRMLIVPLSSICSIVGNGLVLHSVGDRTFGVVALVITLPNLIPFMDLGLGTSLINAFSTKPRDQARREARVAWSMLWMVAAALFLITLVLQLSIGWGRILHVDLSAFHTWGLLVFFALTFAAIPTGIGQRMLTGLDRMPLVTSLGAVSPLVNLGVLALGYAAHRPELFLFGAAAGQFATSVVMFAAATRAAGIPPRDWLHPHLGTNEVRREIAAAAGPMVIITAGLPLALETHRLVLARVAPGELGAYSIAMVLYVPVFGIAAQMAQNLWPYFNNLRAREGNARALDQMVTIQGLVGLIGAVYTTGFLVLAPLVNRVWSHHHIDSRIWWALAIMLFIQLVQYVPGMYLTDPSGFRLQALCVVGMCITTLVLMLVLTPHLGARGPILASATGVLVAQLVPEWIVLRRRWVRAHADSAAEATAA